MGSTAREKSSALLLLAGRIVLGGTFTYSAAAKLQYPWITFATTLDGYKLLPGPAVILTAQVLPWTELALGIWLLAGVALRWAAAVSTLLLALFLAVLVRSWAGGMQIDCGCFGPKGDPLNGWTLVRDGLLLAVSLAVTVQAHLGQRRRPSGAGAVE